MTREEAMELVQQIIRNPISQRKLRAAACSKIGEESYPMSEGREIKLIMLEPRPNYREAAIRLPVIAYEGLLGS